MQARALGRVEVRQQRVADERVDEGELPRLVGRRQDAGTQRRLEALEHRGRRLARHPGERHEAERGADHGRRPQRVRRGLVERREALADRLADAVGKWQRIAGRALVLQASLRGEQLHERVDEERVAGARVVHRLDEPRGDARLRACARAREARDPVAAEARERTRRAERARPASATDSSSRASAAVLR